MSVPKQDPNNLVSNAKIKKNNKAKKKKAAWNSWTGYPNQQNSMNKPNAMKLNPYRFVKAIERTAQFQAPQQGELVDLTDDLAPEISATNTFNTMQLPAPAMQQYSATGSENKLNFKFQKTISKKTPDWTKYQNNFKRISAASPDSDHGEQVEQTPVSTGAQKEIVDLTDQGFDEDVEMRDDCNRNISDLKVAVTTEPFQFLTTQQVKQIHEALATSIQETVKKDAQSYIPAFQQKPVHHLGHLPLTCQGAQDLMWLHETLNTMQSPVPNTKLLLTSQSNLPQLIKVGMFVPDYSGNMEELRMCLQKQNYWYDVSSWTLINSEKQDKGNYYLLFGVSEKQVHIMDNRDRRIAYLLGTLFIYVYNKQWNEMLADKEFNFRNIAVHLLVSVVTEPFRYLTMLEVNDIKSALNRSLKNAILKGDKYIPTFRGHASHYKGGLRLWCESDRDLKWLNETVSSLESPVVGTKLIVKQQWEIPERAKASILLHNGCEDDTVIVKVLRSQNTWCDIDSWVLFSKEKSTSKPGVVVVFYIPVEQVDIIKKNGSRLSYLLGYVNVKFDSCFYE